MVRGLEKWPTDKSSLDRPLSGERGERGHLEGNVDRQVRQDRRKPVGEHALPDTRRPDHRAVVTSGGDHLEAEPRKGVTPDLAEIRLRAIPRHTGFARTSLVAVIALEVRGAGSSRG